MHGGDLAAARRLYPTAPEPMIDLSTGINPHGYPFLPLDPACFQRLPGAGAIAALEAVAAGCYGAPDPACVVAAPGTQILLPRVAALVPPGRAAILAPTYAEHAVAARHAGHAVREVNEPAALAGADLATVVNPNNPDGRVLTRAQMGVLAAGLLVVDEAFMDVGDPGDSMAGQVTKRPVVVLRSFGKFFGMAGVRLGFAIAAPAVAARLRAELGPWAVSGPALAIGQAALADRDWQAAMRRRLAAEAARLDRMLDVAGLAVRGGTSLFRLVEHAAATGLHRKLAEHGLWTRPFADQPHWLRFGLPPDEPAWRRLEAALQAVA